MAPLCWRPYMVIGASVVIAFVGGQEAGMSRTFAATIPGRFNLQASERIEVACSADQTAACERNRTECGPKVYGGVPNTPMQAARLARCREVYEACMKACKN
jgi:hypothetical protein